MTSSNFITHYQKSMYTLISSYLSRKIEPKQLWLVKWDPLASSKAHPRHTQVWLKVQHNSNKARMSNGKAQQYISIYIMLTVKHSSVLTFWRNRDNQYYSIMTKVIKKFMELTSFRLESSTDGALTQLIRISCASTESCLVEADSNNRYRIEGNTLAFGKSGIIKYYIIPSPSLDRRHGLLCIHPIRKYFSLKD